jgi:hypothetical protein
MIYSLRPASLRHSWRDLAPPLSRVAAKWISQLSRLIELQTALCELRSGRGRVTFDVIKIEAR